MFWKVVQLTGRSGSKRFWNEADKVCFCSYEMAVSNWNVFQTFRSPFFQTKICISLIIGWQFKTWEKVHFSTILTAHCNSFQSRHYVGPEMWLHYWGHYILICVAKKCKCKQFILLPFVSLWKINVFTSPFQCCAFMSIKIGSSNDRASNPGICSKQMAIWIFKLCLG